MTTTIKFALAAPLALALAACGSPDNTDERIVDTGGEMDTAGNGALPKVPVEYPQVPIDARSTVSYTGAYSQRMTDGRTRTITLGENDSYTMVSEDGVETSGTFNWYGDNSRILIRDGGGNQVYGIADGYIYRLADKNAPMNGARSTDTTYTRDGEFGINPMPSAR